ncbi:iron complex outermembrane recepter protein [Sphingobium sp. AP50]|uniref:TonB-dependent receptor n=1 Tax=Sphingobium sp. AP50 TaxID=1884369 RepID=UPI0008C5D149|nr:TonB-dependent receptor [Sphingobium sp. AP50]SEJ48110.1 iron complex outermembrane recepter protein [Sphingobium sp. AP50]
MRKILFCTTTLASALILSPGANAQAPSADKMADPSANAQADGQLADDQSAVSGGLADIVVTAQRRAENLQRAAVAVSAVSGDAIVNAGVTDTAALGRLVPSLVVTPTGGSSTAFYLRGVGTLQANAFGENPIALNYGGVYIARPNATSGTFYDLERVEVVKGPQGTLYGRNATGGAINVLPQRPKLGEFGGNVTAEYGNYDSKRLLAAINVPVGDMGAVRLAGQVVDRDGYLSDGYQDEVGQALRMSVLVEPSSRFSALLVADYFHLGGKGVGGVLAPGSAFGNSSGFAYPGYAAPRLKDRIGGADPRSIAALSLSPAPAGTFLANGFVVPPQDDGFNDSSFYGVALTVQADLGFADLTVLPAYRRTEVNSRFYTFGFRGIADEDTDQTSLEVRLSSKQDQRLRYVVGAYAFKEEQDAANAFYQGRISNTLVQPQLETTSKALFGQFTFDVSDALRIVAGGRYTDEKKTQVTPVQLYGPAGLTASAISRGEQNESRFTWKAGIEVDLGPQSLAYANVATGFKAGGFYVGSVANTFNPEKLTAYTIGTKNRFLDNRLQMNIEAFYWDYKDQQISFVGPVQIVPGTYASGGVTVNAGDARFYGVEAEMQYAIVPGGILSINGLYNNTKYTSLSYVAISAGGTPLRSGCSVTPNTSLPVAAPARLFGVDCAGKSGLNAPKWSGTVAYEHTIELGNDYQLILNGRSRLSSAYYVSLEYLPEQRQGSYMQSDASVTIRAPLGRWSLTGFVNNIEGNALIAASVSRPVLQTAYNVVSPPRVYGVRANFEF